MKRNNTTTQNQTFRLSICGHFCENLRITVKNWEGIIKMELMKIRNKPNSAWRTNFAKYDEGETTKVIKTLNRFNVGYNFMFILSREEKKSGIEDQDWHRV